MKLWLAEVDHKDVPGTVPVLITQESRPTDAQVKGRFPEFHRWELEVVSLFDLSHALKTDQASKRALAAWIAAGGMDDAPKEAAHG